MKIGILGHGFIEWGGGLDFLRMICESLAASQPGVELHLLLPTRGPRLSARRTSQRAKRLLKRLLGRAVAAAKTPDPHIVKEFAASLSVNVTVHEIDLGSSAIAAAGRRLDLAAVLPSVQPLKLPQTLPWVGYIADFQHTHLPHFFSAEEIAARDHNFDDMLQRARSVIVNSRQAAADIAAQLPGRPARVFALPFSAAPNPAWLAPLAAPLQALGIAPRFFLISNQFWQHKDHLTAYRALAKVLQTHPDVQLVCTGEPHDFRNPAHFDRLTREAGQLGIGTQLKVLGLIPKLDQIALMRAAQALVQPTLFEGGPGGGAVYDAVALGVPALVSDVAVNREIDEPGVQFFNASDPDDLARLMLQTLAHDPVAAASAEVLLQRGRARRRACGDMLLTAIEHARAAA
jgi:glycosyltransferase involved in cell wall biosynthesis